MDSPGVPGHLASLALQVPLVRSLASQDSPVSLASLGLPAFLALQDPPVFLVSQGLPVSLVSQGPPVSLMIPAYYRRKSSHTSLPRLRATWAASQKGWADRPSINVLRWCRTRR